MSRSGLCERLIRREATETEGLVYFIEKLNLPEGATDIIPSVGSANSPDECFTSYRIYTQFKYANLIYLNVTILLTVRTLFRNWDGLRT